MRLRWLSALILLALPGIGAPQQIELPYEKYELANGLDVILHVDRSTRLWQ